MRKILSFLVTLFISITIFSTKNDADANEVIGCGGFIKSNTEINFKIIQVKLLTKEGVIKYTTEASPVNGYYMIPIYNKGDYILQVNPPPGWSFEPNEVNVKVDGETDACSRNEDINFFFQGFGLSGRVVTQGDSKTNGPEGVKLNLISNGKQIDTTMSGSDGSYYFSNVMPGAYQIEAEHPTITFKTNKVNVVLSKENWSAKENIVVSGFKIEGVATALDKSPLKNILVDLYFNDDKQSVDTKSFQCDHTVKSKLKICQVRTDSNGKFSFGNVAFGKYKLSSSIITKEGLLFDMKPNEIQVDLTKHQNVQITQPFLLNSVSMKSKAYLAENGRTLENGEVLLNGQKSDIKLEKDGSFSLNNLVSGNYRISIQSKNVYYQEKTIKIDLSNAGTIDPENAKYKELLSLSKFVATSFDVCGQVKILNSEQSNTNDLYKSIQIKCFQVTEKDQKLVYIKSVSLDQNYKYCFTLNAKADYIVQADLSDKFNGLMKLVPIERKINLVDKPLFDVNFEQMEAKLEGRLEFLPAQTAPNDLVVTIKSSDSKRTWTKDVEVTCKASQTDKKESFVVCSFSLSNLLFENYQIVTNYDSLFCWKNKNAEDGLKFSISSEKNEFVIQQVGYRLNYELSHTGGLIKILDSNRKNVLYNKNVINRNDLVGSLCLPSLSKYNILVESCHKYTNNKNEDLIQVDSSVFKLNENKISLKAIKHLTTFDVSFKYENSNDKQRIRAEDVSVDVYDSAKNPLEKIQFTLKSEANNELLFTGQSYFESNKLIKFEVKSSKLLFETSQKELTINENNCDANHVKFEAKLGIFILINVKPADIETIDLTLKLKADDSVLLKTSISGLQPHKLGPLKAPFSLYDIVLSKPSYLFNKQPEDSKNVNAKDNYQVDFKAEKLGQLKVTVVDSKNKVNLENVLLSLSSENRLFRDRVKTDQNGMGSFDNLKPGLYYLIVMMLEYEFTPNSHPVQITDGHHMNLVVEANRIAYSCMGRVTSINGQAEKDLLIEAFGIRSVTGLDNENILCKSSQENAKIENELGDYRISNLKPKCEYEIRARYITNDTSNGPKGFSAILPKEYSLIVENADITNRNFVIIPKLDDIDLSVSCKVDSQNNLHSRYSTTSKSVTINFIRLKLFKTNSPDRIIQTESVPANTIAYFNKLKLDPSQKYSIQAELLTPITITQANLNRQLQNLQQLATVERTEISFYADSFTKHLNVNFNLDKKRSSNIAYDKQQQQQYQTIYFTVPLFIIMVSLLLNSQKVKEHVLTANQIIRQRGLAAYLQTFLAKKQEENPMLASQSFLPSSFLKQQAKQQQQQQKFDNGERSRASPRQQVTRQSHNNASSTGASSNNEPTYELNAADDVDNFEFIGDSEIQQLIGNKKTKPKKVF